MTDLDESGDVVARRRLLTGGVAAAGVAAGAVALGVVTARPAAATDGQTLTQGGSFTGTTRTTLTVNDDTVPPLQVSNSTGPALKVTAVNGFAGSLQPGEVTADSNIGLIVGARDDAGIVFPSPVATLDDVYAVPFVRPKTLRLADTRSSSGRTGITIVSGPGYDSSSRLQGGTTVDVRVDDADQDYIGVLINLTSVGSAKAGYLFAYSPALTTRPAGSSVNFVPGQTIANGTFTGVNATGSNTFLRIYASATTHVIVDVTATFTTQFDGPGAQRRASKSGRSAARRITTRRAMRRG